MLRIEILSPLEATEDDLARRQRRYAAQAQTPGISITVHNLRGGPNALNTADDIACSAAAIHDYGQSLVINDSDVIFVDCVFDTAVAELGDSITAPVFGPTAVTLPLITHLADSFSIIARSQQQCELMTDLINQYGYGTNICSLRALGISYEDAKQPALFNRAMIEQIRAVVNDDGAGAIFLGSTTMAVNHEMKTAAAGTPLFMPGMIAISVIELLWRTGALLPATT